jgi:hypothetical protein
MKMEDKEGIKWAGLFFIVVFSGSILIALLCNSVYKIF